MEFVPLVRLGASFPSGGRRYGANAKYSDSLSNGDKGCHSSDLPSFAFDHATFGEQLPGRGFINVGDDYRICLSAKGLGPRTRNNFRPEYVYILVAGMVKDSEPR